MKATQTDGKIYHILWLEESILVQWPYYPRQSTDSMKSLSNYRWKFYRIRTKKFNFVWKHERPRIAKTTSRKNGCWKNHTFWCFSPTLLVGMPTGTATIENSAVIPWITGNRTAIWPSNPTAGSPRKPDLKERHMYPDVHCSTIYDS